MNSDVFTQLFSIADEFGSIAKKVNESSKKRKLHTEKTIKQIDLSLKIGNELLTDIKLISDLNRELQSQNSLVRTTYNLIKNLIKIQKDILAQIYELKLLDEDNLNFLNEKLKTLDESLENAIDLINSIIEKNNQIILLDDLLIIRKNIQKNNLVTLDGLTSKVLNDAEKAIKGSFSNLERGLDMVQRLKNIEKIISKKNTDELDDLYNEAINGWQIAENVNISSNSQFEFAEKVNLFTKQLNEDSNRIKDLVIKKHEIFKENLEPIAELAVMNALELRDYLELEDMIDNIISENNIPDEYRNLSLDLLSYIKIICKNIDNISTLNYDMSDSIDLNAKLEKKTLDLTEQEVEYYNTIHKEVNLMTEATKYPVEGSSKNIENGKKLETFLKEIKERN